MMINLTHESTIKMMKRIIEAMNKNIPEILMTTGKITKKMTQTDEQGKLISGKMKQKCYKIHENIINYNELFKRC